VVNFAQQGLLSKELATILCEVPIEFHEESLRISEVNKEVLSPLLDELEFRTLRKRLLGEESEPVAKEETVSAKASKAAAAGQMDLFGGLVSEKPLLSQKLRSNLNKISILPFTNIMP
jgi:DNA polymerase-1